MSDPVVERLRRSRRICIIGNQGAGKTTAAQRLGRALGLPASPIVRDPREDANAWLAATRARFRAQEAWIVDGDFGLIELADEVIHLDYPAMLCAWRAAKRSARNVLRWNYASARTLREAPTKLRYRLHFLGGVLAYPRRRRQAHVERVKARSAHAIRFARPAELEMVIARIELLCANT